MLDEKEHPKEAGVVVRKIQGCTITSACGPDDMDWDGHGGLGLDENDIFLGCCLGCCLACGGMALLMIFTTLALTEEKGDIGTQVVEDADKYPLPLMTSALSSSRVAVHMPLCWP